MELTNAVDSAPVLNGMVGQRLAREILQSSISRSVHAYLFLGPAGTGKLDSARAFASALVCPSGGCGSCESCRDALLGLHPDITVFERQGAAISIDEAREISLVAQRSPNASSRQVLILTDFHLVAGAAPALLKTIEEPPSTTVFIVVADTLPASLVTIASRCVTVPFHSIGVEAITEALVGEGYERTLASSVATASFGNIDRARLLVGDLGFRERQEKWRAVPSQLDGTGSSVAKTVIALLAGVDEIVSVVRERQQLELAEFESAAKIAGERRIFGLKGIEERHKREQRRVRIDELRSGLATLAGVYLAQLSVAQTKPRRVGALEEACRAIDEAAKYLSRNPNETLLLQALFAHLGDLSA
ncbi:MAG TPA: hypothetical protein VMU99_08235 [Acidimicrobiales bacterium]|nr:hypothetical protein [Acidimicrobiales bacterium]